MSGLGCGMNFIKKLIDIVHFNMSFLFNHRKKNQNFDNFNLPLTLKQTSHSHQIPRKIWIYWQGAECPLVQQCVHKIKQLNPNFEVFFLDQISVKAFSTLDFDELPSLTPQLKSDLIRLDLLSQHGGYWLDATILTYESLEWIQNLVTENKTQSFGYYRKKNTTIKEYPVIETWLLATCPNQDFFKAWKNELMEVIQKTPKAYIQEIKKNIPNPQQYFQKIGMLEYLCAYVAAQRVMRDHPPSITLINCDENAFYIQTHNQWKKHKVLYALAIDYKPDQMPKLIKLVGKERNLVNKYYIKHKFMPDSLLDQLSSSV